MNNPWLKISHYDYENHMLEIGQAQVLNNLTKYYLDKYCPESFALLGCTTGNGLEHIKSETTKYVHAIDINPNYLQRTKERFKDEIKNLKTYNIDIQKSELSINNIDLFFTGLVLEYVEPIKSLNKIIQCLNEDGVLIVIIQKNTHTSSVSKTEYKSLEKLSDIFNEVNEGKIDEFIQSRKMELIKRNEIELTKNKSFILLEYRMKRK